MNRLWYFLWSICIAASPSACLALDAAASAVNADFLWQQGYTGAGVEIGVIDLFMADSSHPAISGNFLGSQKFVNGQSWIDSHATAVAGAALSQDATRRGVAFGAGWWTAQTTNRGSITSSRTQTIAAETFARGLGNLGGNPAEVLTLSIGFTGSDAATDQWSLGLDHLVATHGTTIVVAAGNEGPPTSSISGPPAGSFNILSVGATGGTGAATTEDYSQIAPYSSRGLTADGRSKPDIVAPGSLVNLPTLNGGWQVTSGTSFATPIVAGGAALLVDMGRDRGFNTDATVIKSVLMNSAEKLTGWSNTSTTPLDANFGAGQMNLQSAFHQYDAGEHDVGHVGATGWDHGTILGGGDNLYQFDLNLPAGSELTATLVWNRGVSSSTSNIETTVYTASPLTNLDLLMYDMSDLTMPIASSVSTVDNVEHLFLSLPSAGQYALAVRSLGVAATLLDYALAWNVSLADVPNEPLPGDYNGDGSVDAADYVAWRKAGGTQQQHQVWFKNFGLNAGNGSAGIATALDGSASAVPEPANISIAFIGCVFTVLYCSHGRMRPNN